MFREPLYNRSTKKKKTESGEKMARDRKEYFKERRKKYANFSCEVDKEKLELLEELLEKRGYTKKEWLDMQMEIYLNK